LNELRAIAPPLGLLDRTRNREQRPGTEQIGSGQGDEQARGKGSNQIESIEGGGRSPDGWMGGYSGG